MSSTDVARRIVSALVAHGVTDVIVCPGSRDAPLSYALAAADEAGMLHLTVRLDERSAGFVALGLGKVGRPAAVVTTSVRRWPICILRLPRPMRRECR